MKIIPFLVLILTFSGTKKPLAQPVALARAAVVLEVQTNQVLFSNNPDLQRSVASISKIMTAIIALETTHPDTIITVPEEIRKTVGSMIYVRVGDQLRLLELVYGLMLRSGNDAAVTIAFGVAGGVAAFVELMNQKAEELGMHHSLFRNPHGLDEFDGGNLSTARDMALLMSYALKNESFRTIAGSKEYLCQTTNQLWRNKNRLLSSYNLTTGGKTGYTKKAKRTLVSSAKLDQTELVVVTLDCGSDFAYHKSLYQHFFSLYQTRLLIAEGSYHYDSYLIHIPRNYYFFGTITFWKGAQFVIEINPETEIGELILYASDKRVVLDRLPVEYQELPKLPWYQQFWNWLKGLFQWG